MSVKYTTYVNYGNMPLWQQLMKFYPWLSETESQRIASDAERIDAELPETSRFIKHPMFYKAKFAHNEAKKLKPA